MRGRIEYPDWRFDMSTGTFDAKGSTDFPDDLTPIPTFRVDVDPTVLTITPGLAEEIGLNQCLVLRQLAYLIKVSKHYREGRWWTYQSLNDLKACFSFWSKRTINRAIHKLVDELNLICIRQDFNKREGDNTRWFSLNIDEIAALKSVTVVLIDPKTGRVLQNETGCGETPQGVTKRHRLGQNATGEVQKATALPKITSEIPSKTTSKTTQEILSTDDEGNFSKNEKEGRIAFLKGLGIWDKAIEDVVSSLTIQEINAAWYLSQAKSKNDNYLGHFSTILKNWTQSEADKRDGLELLRSVWECANCDALNDKRKTCRVCGGDQYMHGTFMMEADQFADAYWW
jgi:hypothetical protein